jgi:hypothetical protein
VPLGSPHLAFSNYWVILRMCSSSEELWVYERLCYLHTLKLWSGMWTSILRILARKKVPMVRSRIRLDFRIVVMILCAFTSAMNGLNATEASLYWFFEATKW